MSCTTSSGHSVGSVDSPSSMICCSIRFLNNFPVVEFVSPSSMRALMCAIPCSTYKSFISRPPYSSGPCTRIAGAFLHIFIFGNTFSLIGLKISLASASVIAVASSPYVIEGYSDVFTPIAMSLFVRLLLYTSFAHSFAFSFIFST